MKNQKFKFLSAFQVFALMLALALTTIQCAGVSSSDTEATKAALNKENSGTPPGTVPPGTPTVSPTNVDNPNTPEVDPANATNMTFSEMEYDFGTIKEGEKVSHVFKFKNTGDKALTISNAKGSCGCTVPDYPKTPLAPGETGEISVEFNSQGKKGPNTKYVTINANTIPGETKLTIKANVIGAE